MSSHSKGIHHITVMGGDPSQNVDFYINTLGLRMVKKSVNQDDPGTYHLFYANPSASPGSSLTFFPWPQAAKGKTGTGEASAVSFLVPADSQNYWLERLQERGVPHGELFERFGNPVLPFEDPDGLSLELVFKDTDYTVTSEWQGSVEEEHIIRGFRGPTLRLSESETTAEILTNVLGFHQSGEEGTNLLFETDADIGNAVLIEVTEGRAGRNGRGTVHHVAFRARDEKELNELRWKVAKLGLGPTNIIDRHWFKSVYFHTPGGVLFEMATDGPGYSVDEDPEHLGEQLVLPPWLESKREEIEDKLPELNY